MTLLESDMVTTRAVSVMVPEPRATTRPDDTEFLRRTAVRHLLALYSDVLSDDVALDVGAAHRIGSGWAESGRSLETLLEAVRSLTGDLVDRALNRRNLRGPEQYCAAVRKISEVGGRILIELTQGFRQASADPQADEELTQRKRAQLLLSGVATPPHGVHYAVVALTTAGQDPALTDAAFRMHGGEHTLSLLGEDGGHVLLSAATEADAESRCHKAVATLGSRAHAALVWPVDRDLPTCRSVADDILSEAAAMDLPPGVHTLDDVLLEFAAAREPTVSNVLLKVIQPLLTQPVLWETLEVLLAEDGHRGRVAKRLVLHRSTVDYRLQRIGQLTGHSPCTIRGLRVLATASTLHRLSELRRARAAA